ncbi:MAG: permease [Bacteroidales bacterium]
MIMDYLGLYLKELVSLTSEMAPYLLLGFLFAGILHVYFQASKMNRYFGGTKLKHVINASVLGIPLPLCSCGVIPTGVSFYKNGASKSSSISFLISTPQTGVDSILATYSLIGLPFAIIRPLVALVSGIFGGWLSGKTDKKQFDEAITTKQSVKSWQGQNKFKSMLWYGFVEFMADIAKWLVIGLLLAALISVIIPDGFFEQHISNDFVGMLILLVAAIPMYVCATGSIPVVAVLMLKGISPGAALVFLMAGPATNIASMTVLGKVFGRKTLFAYMGSIIGSALLFGWLINQFLPREWFMQALEQAQHGGHLIPLWAKYISAAIFTILLLNALYRRYFKEKSRLISNNKKVLNMKTIQIKIDGMTCNHCKMTVEKHLSGLKGIDSVQVDLNSGTATIIGHNPNIKAITEKVDELGYTFVKTL